MITIGRFARSMIPMASSENSVRLLDEEAWHALRGRLLHITHSVQFEALRRRRPGLVTRCQPGVFVAESSDTALNFAAEAMDDGLFVAWIDGERIAGEADFLIEAARTLRFPDYFGHNWNAFEECIRDLEWLPARGYVLVLAGYERFARNDPRNWKIGLDVLKEAVNAWGRTDTPMYVVLQGPRDGAPDVSALRCAHHTT
jgi:hypothetical protein